VPVPHHDATLHEIQTLYLAWGALYKVHVNGIVKTTAGARLSAWAELPEAHVWVHVVALTTQVAERKYPVVLICVIRSLDGFNFTDGTNRNMTSTIYMGLMARKKTAKRSGWTTDNGRRH